MVPSGDGIEAFAAELPKTAIVDSAIVRTTAFLVLSSVTVNPPNKVRTRATVAVPAKRVPQDKVRSP